MSASFVGPGVLPSFGRAPSPVSSVTGVDMLLSDVAMGRRNLIKMVAIAWVSFCLFFHLQDSFSFSLSLSLSLSLSDYLNLLWSLLVFFGILWYLLISLDLLSSPLLSFGLFKITSGHFG